MRQYFISVVVVFLLFNDAEAIEYPMPVDIDIVFTAYGISGNEYPKDFNEAYETVGHAIYFVQEKTEWDARISLIHLPPQDTGNVENLITFDQGKDVKLMEEKMKDLEDEMRQQEGIRARMASIEFMQLFEAAIRNIKESPSNREDAIDVMLWFVRGDCQYLVDGRQQLPTNDRLLMFVVMCGEKQRRKLQSYYDYGLAKKGRWNNREWNLYTADDSNGFFARWNLLRGFIQCKAEIICFFDSNEVCNTVVAFHSAIADKSPACHYVPTIKLGQCAEGRAACERRCNEKEPKEYYECPVTCGAVGSTKVRPANPENDPTYARCPWVYNVPCPSKPRCEGPPPASQAPSAKVTTTRKTTRKRPTHREQTDEIEEIGTREIDETHAPPRPKSTPTPGLKWSMIVAIFMVILLLIVATVAVLICCLKKRKRRRLEKFYVHGREPPPPTQFGRSYDSRRRISQFSFDSCTRERADHRSTSTQFSRDRRSTNFRGSGKKAISFLGPSSRPTSGRLVSQWNQTLTTRPQHASASVLASRSSISVAKFADGPRSKSHQPTSQMGKLPRLPSKSSVGAESPSLPTTSQFASRTHRRRPAKR